MYEIVILTFNNHNYYAIVNYAVVDAFIERAKEVAIHCEDIDDIMEYLSVEFDATFPEIYQVNLDSEE